MCSTDLRGRERALCRPDTLLRCGTRLRHAGAEIVALSDEYRAHYRSAYRILRAMGEVESERRVAMHAQMDFSKLRRRTDGILARELRGEGGGNGRVDRAFLGGVTHRGEDLPVRHRRSPLPTHLCHHRQCGAGKRNA